ncbi:lipoprotein [Pseudomonas syringae]|uniref:Lipoprotein n=1 Tax=Pseudomonas syringae TaxID=317 RepID=A0A0L1M4G3_PSESX|nr:lipoprotein [Pseudomonas syringae]
MTAIARITLLSMVLGLSACAVQQPEPTRLPPIPPSGPSTKPPPPTVPSKPSTPVKPSKPVPRTSASFAPPPGGNSHWDAKLGVYVLDDQTNTFYRQRTYYRWNNGWSRSISPNGPWEETNINGVPGGLGRKFGQ